MKKIIQIFDSILSLIGRDKKVEPFKPCKTPYFQSRKIRTNNWGIFIQKVLVKNPMVALSSIILLFVLINMNFLKQYSYLFKASLLDVPKVEFTGTVNPIEKVPNWVALTDAERLMNFNQIPKSKLIALPEYKISDFQNGQEWSPTNEDQRNAYITYPVPNLGNYKLDGTENSGSHPGVDIKTPIGTPVRAIANGYVHVTGNQSTGFGKFISIVHSGLPTDQTGGNETLYSNYAHLSVVSVIDGQKVEKGQIIGEVGNTGMATTPHLHFQIDTADAPFHPYWPFSWSDVQNAGLSSYFEAVKQGLGKENAQKYTVHPINFVTKNINYVIPQNLVVSADPEIIKEVIQKEVEIVVPVEMNEVTKIEVIDEEPMKTVASKEEVQEESKVEEKIVVPTLSKKMSVNFKTDRSFVPGETESVLVEIDKAALVASAGIALSSTLKERATVSPETLYQKDFKDGVAKITVKTSSPYTFKLVAKGDFGESKSQSLRPEIFTDVPSDHAYSTAIKYLRDSKVVKGYSDGTFKPEDSLNRAEALKMILVANSIPINAYSVKFHDMDSGDWYWKYVGTAVAKEIVKGYEDQTFRAGNTVTRAEFLKMAILSANKKVSAQVEISPYTDIKEKSWYASYFQFAKKYELLRTEEEKKVFPNNAITRGEAADIIYRISRIK